MVSTIATAGLVVSLISTWLFGGIIGFMIGLGMLLYGIFTSGEEWNIKVAGMGASILFMSTFIIGGAIGVTLGLLTIYASGFSLGQKYQNEYA